MLKLKVLVGESTGPGEITRHRVPGHGRRQHHHHQEWSAPAPGVGEGDVQQRPHPFRMAELRVRIRAQRRREDPAVDITHPQRQLFSAFEHREPLLGVVRRPQCLLPGQHRVQLQAVVAEFDGNRGGGRDEFSAFGERGGVIDLVGQSQHHLGAQRGGFREVSAESIVSASRSASTTSSFWSPTPTENQAEPREGRTRPGRAISHSPSGGPG